MLRELHIVNLAVIEDAHVELGAGLNCITGQTGAGKSLFIGAFEVLLGLRSAGDLLRDGTEEGRVSGVFELTDPEMIEQANAIADLSLDVRHAPEQLLITRKLFASGRTSVTLNGQPATLGMLARLGELLVDVHGQHDHQYLLKPANQLLMLDRFAECEPLRKRYAELHRELHDAQQRRQTLEASATLRRQQLDLYTFQAEEIDAVEPTEDEYEELAARHRVLSNLERIQRDAAQVYGAVYESDGSAAERLQIAIGTLAQLAELDEELNPLVEEMRSALAQLQDAAFSLNRYTNRLDLDTGELEEIEQRLNALNRLIQKYGSTSGGSLDEVLAYREQIAGEITKLTDESEDLTSIADQIAATEQEMMTIGGELTAKRSGAAQALCPDVETQLAELGMAEATLTVRIDTAEAPGESASGLDEIELLIATNPGQEPRPLRKIASGGELSRIMLALKSILAQADRVSVLVFDEIDSNIGGRMGTVIGDKLRRLAGGHQVLCITHLPQIAAYADHHLKLAKNTDEGRARTDIQVLIEKQRIDELAEMLAGKSRSATTRKQAKELLTHARQ